MEILSIIPDHRIKASNVLVTMTIEEYLKIARAIRDENDYQRKKVIKSGVKEQLKSDLLTGCTIPPIVLAIKESSLDQAINYIDFNDNDFIIQEFEKKNLIILDGLQRTYVIIEIDDDLKDHTEPKEIEKYTSFLQQTIRCEVYVGLSKLGILYRMLTLNTGQTTMSSRHLMEILYLDYSDIDIDGKKLIRDKDDKLVKPDLTEFKFKDILDGYYSYIEGKEVPLPRADILDNIQTLQELEQTDEEKEDFKKFFEFYVKLVKQIVDLSDGYEFNSDDHEITEYSLSGPPFGKNALNFFKKSQALTGLGSALYFIKKQRGKSIDSVVNELNKITLSPKKDSKETFRLLNKYFDYIRSKSKKIGNDQRYFYKIFFRYLLDPESDSYLFFDEAQDMAYQRIRERLEETWG
jgi:hypothetical protein